MPAPPAGSTTRHGRTSALYARAFGRRLAPPVRRRSLSLIMSAKRTLRRPHSSYLSCYSTHPSLSSSDPRIRRQAAAVILAATVARPYPLQVRVERRARQGRPGSVVSITCPWSVCAFAHPFSSDAATNQLSPPIQPGQGLPEWVFTGTSR